MSVQQALNFIRHCRNLTPAIGEEISCQKLNSLAEAVEWAIGEGFEITEDELRQAFVVDWKLRWMIADSSRAQSI